ncbi:GntR family transcriptional regulator [Acrocarpospora catenulata]|uniref:GntR family transcriptional regulator n=1 Tax=Acrocarpospora catenulata TaxID=2836182 RepID=UPI001BDB2E3F|nr:GntR family transcriptional regulator [Acrocarpospora catenulata]
MTTEKSGATHHVTATLVEKIRNGELAPGDPFPRGWELVRTYRINRGVAALVYHRLLRMGLVRPENDRAIVIGPSDLARLTALMPESQQIDEAVNVIIDRIRTGEIGPHRRAASLRGLSSQYDVSVRTAKKVITALTTMGWVYTVPNRGTFAVPKHLWPTESPNGVSPEKLNLTGCTTMQALESRLAVHLGFPHTDKPQAIPVPNHDFLHCAEGRHDRNED